MGEYYDAFNLDKRESVLLGKLDEFLLMGNHNAELTALLTVPSYDIPDIYDPRTGEGIFGRWAGDRLWIVGGDHLPPELDADAFTEIGPLVTAAVVARRRVGLRVQTPWHAGGEGVSLRLRIDSP